MWRSIFLAIGITCCIVGLECLVIEEAVIAQPPARATLASGDGGAVKEFKTQEWMPWSFMSAGAVVILYTITLPKRFQV